MYNKIMKQNITFDYTALVAEAYRDYPETEGRVTFIDLAQNVAVHPDATEAVVRMKKACSASEIKLLMSEYASDGCSCAHETADGHRFVMIYTHEDVRPLIHRGNPAAKDLVFTFDHEFAHALFKNGLGQHVEKTYKESLCDTYALLRQIQRFGYDDRDVTALIENRLRDNIMFGDTSHMSADSILWIAQHVDIDKVRGLSPAETAAYAEKIADATATCQADSEALSKTFNRIRRKIHRVEHPSRGQGFLTLLKSEVEKTNKPIVRKWGGFILDKMGR